MKPIPVLSALILAAGLVAPVAAADPATPDNPSAFGQATKQNANAGTTGGFVSGLATSNPPGTVADDVAGARDALGSTPTPPGRSASDD